PEIEGPEHVVVAGRGVVAGDGRVPGTHPAAIEDVDPAADTLAVLPTGARGAARGLVAGDVHVLEAHGGQVAEDAAPTPADAAVRPRPRRPPPGAGSPERVLRLRVIAQFAPMVW